MGVSLRPDFFREYKVTKRPKESKKEIENCLLTTRRSIVDKLWRSKIAIFNLNCIELIVS